MKRIDKVKIAKYDLAVAKRVAGRKKIDPKKKLEWKRKADKAQKIVDKYDRNKKIRRR